jgi:hypothetical protein
VLAMVVYSLLCEYGVAGREIRIVVRISSGKLDCVGLLGASIKQRYSVVDVYMKSSRSRI